MGVVPPAPGFTEGLRRITAAHGALLVSRRGDDRLPLLARPGGTASRGRMPSGAPDLFTFGKVMGGGFPAAAFGGRADVMALLAPAGPVYQAGTLSGNPVATAAGLATLQRLHARGLRAARRRQPTPSPSAVARRRWTRRACRTPSSGPGSMFSVFFRDGAVRDYDDARAQRRPAFAAFFHAMLSQGVHLPPSAFEAWFVCAAHDDEAVDRVLAAVPDACRRRGPQAFATIDA